jgi:lipopolysaccharide/colanic/teichoic acid biosynthesis glycosyltransferase
LLRASGLDELPQVFNILAGKMSLVGPRPCTPHEFARYTLQQQKRVNALPGLTGYWQVNGKNKTTFPKMIAMDICYIRNISPRLDLSIIFKTIPVLIRQVIETRQRRRSSNRISVAAPAPATTTNNQRL